MNLKSLSLKLAGALLAAAIAVTALSGNVNRVSADGFQCLPKACPVIDIRPDLTVQNLRVFKGSNGKLVIQYQERNDGVTASGNFRLKVLVNGALAYQNVEPGLAAGQTVNVTLNRPLPVDHLAVVQVAIDTDDDVSESEELNNAASMFAIW